MNLPLSKLSDRATRSLLLVLLALGRIHCQLLIALLIYGLRFFEGVLHAWHGAIRRHRCMKARSYAADPERSVHNTDLADALNIRNAVALGLQHGLGYHLVGHIRRYCAANLGEHRLIRWR